MSYCDCPVGRARFSLVFDTSTQLKRKQFVIFAENRLRAEEKRKIELMNVTIMSGGR